MSTPNETLSETDDLYTVQPCEKHSFTNIHQKGRFLRYSEIVDLLNKTAATQSEPKPAVIVAEVSKTWIAGESTAGAKCLASLFQDVCQHNYQRGYKLHSFKFSQTSTDCALIETVIAVFELDPAR